jgi:hypothetical protein
VALHVQESLDKLGIDSEVTHFADEFKRMYCAKSGVNFERLMADRDYKVLSFLVPELERNNTEPT